MSRVDHDQDEASAGQRLVDDLDGARLFTITESKKRLPDAGGQRVTPVGASHPGAFQSLSGFLRSSGGQRVAGCPKRKSCFGILPDRCFFNDRRIFPNDSRRGINRRGLSDSSNYGKSEQRARRQINLDHGDHFQM